MNRALPRPDLGANWAYLLALVLTTAMGATWVREGLTNRDVADMSAFRDTAMRTRSGDGLYGGDVHLNSTYRCAPCAAWPTALRFPSS